MKKFTLIELLVVVAIIGILASLLLPSLGRARRSAQIAVCISQLKQTNIGLVGYLDDNDSRFPFLLPPGGDPHSGRHWLGKKGDSAKFAADVTERPLNQYFNAHEDGSEVKVAECPNDAGEYTSAGTSYMASGRNNVDDDLDWATEGATLSSISEPVRMVSISETGAWHWADDAANPWAGYTQNHESGKANYTFSFIDGHARYLKNIQGKEGIGWHSSRFTFSNSN